MPSDHKGFASDFHYFLIKIPCRNPKCAFTGVEAIVFPPIKATNTEFGFAHKINWGKKSKGINWLAYDIFFCLKHKSVVYQHE